MANKPAQDIEALLTEAETNGDNYDISTEDIIARLKKWQTISSFQIVQPEFDGVTLAFDRLPEDLDAFVKEAVEFCPDLILDDEEAERPHLVAVLKKAKMLQLWWD